jgi:hypothetical protein
MIPENPFPRLSDLEAEADFAEMAGDQEPGRLGRLVAVLIIVEAAAVIGTAIAAWLLT